MVSVEALFGATGRVLLICFVVGNGGVDEGGGVVVAFLTETAFFAPVGGVTALAIFLTGELIDFLDATDDLFTGDVDATDDLFAGDVVDLREEARFLAAGFVGGRGGLELFSIVGESRSDSLNAS